MNKPSQGLVKNPFRSSIFSPFFSSFPAFFEEGVGEDFETVASSNISLSEDNNNVFVEANLPGLKDDDIELTLDKGVLWIKGAHKEESENKERKYYYKASRSFSYRVSLPSTVDESAEPAAKFENGVIHVAFKKVVAEKPKKIAIKRS